MKVKVCAVVMAAIASFLPINAAEVYTVAAGETFELTDDNNLHIIKIEQYSGVFL